MGDPVIKLVHDHGEINRRVLAVGVILRELEGDGGSPIPRALIAPLTELRELLFAHFAREEEGLFPFVADAFAELAPRVEELHVTHDTICGRLARMHALATSNGPLAAMVILFRRFESTYAEHATTEAALLRDLEGRLDDSQRGRLTALVAGL